jgi:hypothetical protein
MNKEKQTMNMKDIIAYISVNATRDDLNAIARAHRFRTDSLRQVAKAQFFKGDTVTWTNSRNGLTMTGSVNKLNRKTIDVRTREGFIWRVSAQLLKKG